MDQPRFLVVYDYGQGGVWAYVLADSRADILACYPELTVVEGPPSWMSDELKASLRTYRLVGTEPGLLADIRRSRSSAR